MFLCDKDLITLEGVIYIKKKKYYSMIISVKNDEIPDLSVKFIKHNKYTHLLMLTQKNFLKTEVAQ